MKTAVFGVLLILSFSSLSAAQWWRDDRAKLCFLREEDNGAIKLLQSWIRVGGYEVPVRGGQAVCLYVRAGNHELTATSTLPYDPHPRNPEACKSKPLKLELAANDERTFNVAPATNRDGYACGWLIKPRPAGRKVTPALGQ